MRYAVLVSTFGLIAGLILLLNSGYLLSSNAPTLFYLANVVGHTLGGALLTPLFFYLAWRLRRWCWTQTTHLPTRLIMLFSIGFWQSGLVVGLGLILLGTSRAHHWILVLHITLCTLAMIGILIAVASRYLRPALSPRLHQAWQLGVIGLIVAGLIPLVTSGIQAWQPDPFRITNPPLPPLSQDDEGMGGKTGPFHPSGVVTSTGGTIPSTFFMTSKRCADCHADIYQQWSESAHHFSSFNNQWYRKSIEYMQDVVGTRPSRWCAGCHDVALLFNGMMDTPVAALLDTPEAHVGLACTACHAITQVRDTMGNGDYHITYPALHDLMISDNRLIHWLHDFLVHVDPAPHREVFLKPFHHNSQSPQFCSTCHKAHLDTHVNQYRWVRGFNEYDAWQASGVSGYGARSFYYPDQPKTCNDCHMPLVPSTDRGNRNGYVHSHRFPGANTALPTANHHPEQLAVTKTLLQSGVVTVDIFAISPALPQQAHQAKNSSAPAKETAARISRGSHQPPSAPSVQAPLDLVSPTVRRDSEVRVDVVVRNRGVGHFFPGGTSDAFDVWIEFKAVDEHGQVLFWSGNVANDGKGPVDPLAHRYGSMLADAHGNVINKRNAWASRAVVYARAIPPGAAEVVHYRLPIPAHAGNQIKLTAKLHYRKFSWWNTQWAYAGVRDPQQKTVDVTPDYDDGNWVFSGDTTGVSGAMKSIPTLPIVTMASAITHLTAVDFETPETFQKNKSKQIETDHKQSLPVLRERWNDYGIGLLLQGDLKGATSAFLQVTKLDPNYIDGWVNLGRVYLQDGDLDQAHTSLTRALGAQPDLPRAHFFLAMVFKAEGDYETALHQLQRVATAHPQDRVVRNQIGRLHFLLKQYEAARVELQHVLQIDPEDLQAHYNLML